MARVKRIARWNETQQAKHLGIADARAVKGAPDHVQAALDLPAEGELRTLPHIRLGLTARRVLCAARARDKTSLSARSSAARWCLQKRCCILPKRHVGPKTGMSYM